MNLSEIKKTVISVLTLVVSVGTPLLNYLGIFNLPANVVYTISTVVAIAGSILHYLVPNTTTDPEVAQRSSVKLVAAK
jgi:hypothetical protein